MSVNFEKEAVFQTARSSGKGGQHVNKTETKVILMFHVFHSALLTEEQKQRLKIKLKNLINKDGFLILTSEKYKSQLQNKKDVIKKLNELIQKYLKVKIKRIPTKISRSQKEQRLKKKKKHSEKKQLRKNPPYR